MSICLARHNLVSHYSFVFAQQVHYPPSPQQPLSTSRPPESVGGLVCWQKHFHRWSCFFWIRQTTLASGPTQLHATLFGQWLVIGLKEAKSHLHADESAVQNKNNAMLQYLLWRVMIGRHKKVTLSFLVVGHTTVLPDWAFGMFNVCSVEQIWIVWLTLSVWPKNVPH